MSKRFVKLLGPIRALKQVPHPSPGITFVRQQNGDGVYSVNVMATDSESIALSSRESEGVTRTQPKISLKGTNDARRAGCHCQRDASCPRFYEAQTILDKLTAEAERFAMKRTLLTRHLIPFFGNTPFPNRNLRHERLRCSEAKSHRCASA